VILRRRNAQGLATKFSLQPTMELMDFMGFVTQKLQQLIDEGRKIDFVLAIGPIPMMAAVAKVTKPYNIKTVVSLNPI